MSSLTETQIRNMVERYRTKLGIRRKIAVNFLDMRTEKFHGFGGIRAFSGPRITLNSKVFERFTDDDVKRLVVHEMMHAWKAEYSRGGPKGNRGHSAAFYRAYYQSLRILGIPPDRFHPMNVRGKI